MTSVVDGLREQLEQAETDLNDAENRFAAATLTQLEAKADLETCQRSVKALTTAIEQITGVIEMPEPAERTVNVSSEGQEGGLTVGDFLVNGAPAQIKPEPSIIMPAQSIPGPAADPNSKAVQEGWVKGADGRLYEPGQVRTEAQVAQDAAEARQQANATGPKCGACGTRGTLQQMQHDSGRIMTVCTKCNNQIW